MEYKGIKYKGISYSEYKGGEAPKSQRRFTIFAEKSDYFHEILKELNVK